MTVATALAQARFLTRDRAETYGLAAFVVYLVIAAIGSQAGAFFVDHDGRPIAADFLAFWASGFVALTDPGALYDVAQFKAAQVTALGHGFDVEFFWAYPPMLLLATASLSMTPYLAAWFVWVVATAGFFACALRLMLPGRLAIALVLGAPTSLWCALVGQNGFLTAGLMACGLGLLESRPICAGACIGLLTYKPQFGVLFPLFLIVDRQGRAFAAATATALLLAALSAALFGVAAWRAFLASLSHSGEFLLAGGSAWFKLQSFYAIADQAIGDRAVALDLHFAFCAVVVLVLLRLWTRRASRRVKSAALVAGAFLMTPYAYIYDAVILTTGAALLASDGLARGFLPWEKLTLVAALAAPILFLAVGSVAAPVEALLILAVAARRTVRGGAPES